MVKLELKELKYTIINLVDSLHNFTATALQVQPADKVVERLISQIVSQEPGYQYFKAEPGLTEIRWPYKNIYNF